MPIMERLKTPTQEKQVSRRTFLIGGSSLAISGYFIGAFADTVSDEQNQRIGRVTEQRKIQGYASEIMPTGAERLLPKVASKFSTACMVLGVAGLIRGVR